MTIDVVTSRKVARHHGSTTGRTHSTGNGKAMEVGAFLSEPIDVGSLHIGVAMTAKVAPTPVIGEDEQNVGATLAVMATPM